MLFRKSTGELIEIKKYDFINDKIYYSNLYQLKKEMIDKFYVSSPKLKNGKINLNKTFHNKNNQ